MINGYEMATRGEFVMAGYLIKSPPDNKPMAQWHRRWFLLMDSRLVYPLADRFVRLEYYQSEAEARRFADPKGNRGPVVCPYTVCQQPHFHCIYILRVPLAAV